MASFIDALQPNLVYGHFSDLASLQAEVYRALVDFLKRRGALPVPPFDASPCEGASMRDISAEKVGRFLRLSKEKRRLSLPERSSPSGVLKNFHLLVGRTPSRAAVLLFGTAPNRLLPGVEIQCLRFDGREKAKPIRDQRIFDGTVFEMIDSALGFVLDKIESRVGIARGGASAPIAPEIPEFVVREAIVNAVAHRDYSQHGFVQVIVFADRVEVWNPGHLPHGLSFENLRVPHGPVPHNPLIAEPLFRAGYAEKAGTGTTDMICAAVAAGLPEPDFEQHGPHFVVTIWRDWLTPEHLAALQLSDRLLSAVLFVKDRGRVSNSQYRNLFGVAKRTASQDLAALVELGLIEKEGTTGKGVFYRMAKGAAKGHKGHGGVRVDVVRPARGKGALKGHKGYDRKDAVGKTRLPRCKRGESL